MTLTVNDLDGDNLILTTSVTKDGEAYYTKSVSKTSPYTAETITFDDLDSGTYSGVATVTDGIESASKSFTFTVNPNTPPTIDITCLSTELMRGDDNEITVSVNDVNADDLELSVKVFRNNVLYENTAYDYYKVSPYTDESVSLSDLRAGTYTIKGYVSDDYSSTNAEVTFTVLDNSPPTIAASVTKSLCYEGDDNTIVLVVSDDNLDPLTVSISVKKDSTAYFNDTFNITAVDGSYPLKEVSLENLPSGLYSGTATVYDGYETASDTFDFEVIENPIGTFVVSGAWHHWRGQVDAFGKTLANMPHRFLSFESVTFNATLNGTIEAASLILSPELMAMSYTDDSGNVYDYADDFGEDVVFPLSLEMTSNDIDKGTSQWEVSYILPLADSTLNWDDQRNSASYFAKLSVIQNGRIFETTIDDIDLTGNTMDLIFVQPSYN